MMSFVKTKKGLFWYVVSAVIMLIAFYTMVLFLSDKWNFTFSGWLPWLLFSLSIAFWRGARSLEKKQMNLYRLLYRLSYVDGILSNDEEIMLREYANQNGIYEHARIREVNKIKTGKDKNEIPEAFIERKKFLQELIKMMKADGNIHESEKRFILHLAKQYSIDEDYVSILLS